VSGQVAVIDAHGDMQQRERARKAVLVQAKNGPELGGARLTWREG